MTRDSGEKDGWVSASARHTEDLKFRMRAHAYGGDWLWEVQKLANSQVVAEGVEETETDAREMAEAVCKLLQKRGR